MANEKTYLNRMGREW